MPTITVETGAIVPGANSYVSLADADAYHAAMGNDWDSTTDTETFEQALIVAARSVDTLWGSQFLGSLLSDHQPLLFPRTAFQDTTGRVIARAAIPRALRDAQCEIALLALAGQDVMPFPASGTIQSESVSVDVISRDITYSAPKAQAEYPGLEKVALILGPILRKAGANWRIRV